MPTARISVGWAAVAAGSLAALAVFAPDGLWLLAFLGIVIVTHEAGHLIVARRAGMRPTEFYWGFGPEVVALQVGDCRYGLKAVFLGGYVQLVGMTPSATLPEGFDEAATYRAASHRGRVATILAGPAVNLVLAWLAFVAAALLEGEGPVAAIGRGADDVWFVVEGTAQALGRWITHLGDYVASLLDLSGATEAPVRFMSPVAQAEVSGWVIESGPVAVLRWFGVLSCAIGAVNLIPLPPLDGAHAAVAGLDAIRHRFLPGSTRPLDMTRAVPLAYLTVTVLIALSLSALVLDVRDLI
ncbi:MAG: site-2 protease family protein [Acidimicrobiales bacterium]